SNPQPLAHDPTAGHGLDCERKLRAQRLKIRQECVGQVADVTLIRKIELRLNLGSKIQQALPPADDLSRNAARKASKRLLALRLGLRSDQVAKALNFSEVEFPVLEGTAGKLTRLSKAGTLRAREKAEQASHDSGRPMHLKFRAIFPGEALGPREPRD